MTELEIINSMLAAIGVNKVTSVESLHPSAIAARDVLKRVNKYIQARGWYFNEVRNLTLLPNSANEIIVPTNALSIDSEDIEQKVVPRGRVLYDMQRNTQFFTGPVTVRVVSRLDIEALPEMAAEYIRTSAVYEFFVQQDGEGDKLTVLKNAQTEAYGMLNREDIKWRGVNALQSPRALSVLSPRYNLRYKRY